jgi:hypothetical protein
MQEMQSVLAVEFTTVVLVVVAVLSVLLLILIVVAPWRQVRREPPMDKAVEARLLLHRNPDEPTGEVPRVTAVPSADQDGEAGAGDLSGLTELNDPPEPPTI